LKEFLLLLFFVSPSAYGKNQKLGVEMRFPSESSRQKYCWFEEKFSVSMYISKSRYDLCSFRKIQTSIYIRK